MKLTEDQILHEIADISNDRNWGNKDFICMKKIPEQMGDFPALGFMLRDERDAIYSGDCSILEERTDYIQEKIGNQINFSVKRKEDAERIPKKELTLMKKYPSLRSLVEDGWIVD